MKTNYRGFSFKMPFPPPCTVSSVYASHITSQFLQRKLLLGMFQRAADGQAVHVAVLENSVKIVRLRLVKKYQMQSPHSGQPPLSSLEIQNATVPTAFFGRREIRACRLVHPSEDSAADLKRDCPYPLGLVHGRENGYFPNGRPSSFHRKRHFTLFRPLN